ncbi:phospholipid transfer protein C2CD2L isoform X2 [Aricia agestis]|uniref:phospholipid transfer protein C2CD2L isoform X2 n=1 Tax=Aricia agestis TaxID=91739 RepID=UPI001C20B11B|nr:phospholipid transfer protein C2CD2L isoform X2 [Aricia agestis]
MPSPASSEAGAVWWHTPWKTMADLAEAVDDLICSFDYMDTAMDNLVMLIFIWILFSIVIIGIAKWLYKRYAKVEAEKPKENVVIPEKKVVAEVEVKKTAAFKPSKPSGFVPPTPPNKKRVGRMSPGPEQLTLKKHQSIIIPTCTGPDGASVQWVNDLLVWLYNDLVIVNELVQQWIVSMNDFSKKSVEEQGIGVELVRALDSHPPTISNVFCECDSKDDVTITCDCEATPAFQLKAFSQRGEKVEVSHYRVNVNRFRARLHVVCITEKLCGELKCDGWPEVKVALAPVGPLRPNTAETDLQQSVSDIVVSALRNSKLAFNLSAYPTCPRLRRYEPQPERRLPLHYDSMVTPDRLYTSTPNSTMTGAQLLSDKRLLVKIVAAKDLGGKSGCVAPYCVVEMDEPPQRNQTAFKKDTTSPVWEEHFLFDLSPQTAELLFEVYDRIGPPSPGGAQSQHRFLGLGLVGIDELLAAPSQRQQIGLQTRPMEDHDVSGSLTVEFLFIEGADIPDIGSKPLKIKESLRTATPHGYTTTTKTTFQQNGAVQGDRLTESALRELELSSAGAANKSTLIIHSVQREPTKSIKVELTDSGKFIEVEREAQEVQKKGTEDTEKIQDKKVEKPKTPTQSPAKSVRIKENGAKVNGDSEKQGDYVNNQEPPPPEPAPRQKKRRDFFGTIKRRLGRSRTRGQSLELSSDQEVDQHIRSVSAERNNHDKALSLPNRNVYSAGASPAQSGDESRTSRRSSLSEVSGFSTASARTFIHEASTLVLETIEAGIKKHYLVPLTVAQRSRWRRKGVKLHIYSEHTFIAKHLSGGTVCEVCNKTIARRLGKQGYECRDCQLKCHKHCHVKVAVTCPHSTVHNMELAYISSPYTDKNIRML